jgi:hypothetical protein
MTEVNPVVVTEKKPWYHSKTLWFVVLVEALAALEASFGLLQPYLPGNVYAYLLVFLGVGVKALRIITTQGLTK